MKTIGIVFAFFSLLLIPYNAYAEDQFQIIGQTLTHDPTICALEPRTDIPSAWKNLSKYTRWAVLDWENKLNQFNRVKDVWNLELQSISLEKQTSELKCDVVINFEPKPENQNDEFQVSGYTENHSKNNINIVVYFLNVEVERVDYTEPSERAGYYYSVVKWIPSYADYLTPEEPLKMTIKHEIGHALGLGHYITTNEAKLQSWYDGIQRPPSIMIPTKPTKVISADITQLDLEMITRIYGKDGFYSDEKIDKLDQAMIDSDRIVLPDWIKNNAKWWADERISDKDFAAGIEHMIKNDIIKVPVYGTNNFSAEQKIPDWIKSNAKWWADGLISDSDFVKGIEYLANSGIIRVN